MRCVFMLERGQRKDTIERPAESGATTTTTTERPTTSTRRRLHTHLRTRAALRTRDDTIGGSALRESVYPDDGLFRSVLRLRVALSVSVVRSSSDMAGLSVRRPCRAIVERTTRVFTRARTRTRTREHAHAHTKPVCTCTQSGDNGVCVCVCVRWCLPKTHTCAHDTPPS